MDSRVFLWLFIFLSTSQTSPTPSHDCSAKKPWPNRTQLSWQSRAFFYKGFLIDEECDNLIDLAKNKLKISMVANNESGKSIKSEVRTSSGMFLRKQQIPNGVVLPDKASLYLTAIEDAEYKEDKIEFWNNVYGFDMSCIRKQLMMEPLVDTVDQNEIVTNCQLLKTMDISKMTSGDASFTAPFKRVAERNDYIHALVAYFDVSFTKCHKLMGFSTGPRSRATHWKQTVLYLVLYLEDVITISKKEEVVGSMTVAPNKNNPRDVDITERSTLPSFKSPTL